MTTMVIHINACLTCKTGYGINNYDVVIYLGELMILLF